MGRFAAFNMEIIEMNSSRIVFTAFGLAVIAGSGSALAQSRAIVVEPRSEVAAPTLAPVAPAPVVETPKAPAPAPVVGAAPAEPLKAPAVDAPKAPGQPPVAAAVEPGKEKVAPPPKPGWKKKAYHRPHYAPRRYRSYRQSYGY